MRSWVVVAGVAVLSGLVLVRSGQRRRTRGPSLLPPGTRLLLVGDSLAVGLAQPMAELYRARGVSFRAEGTISTNAAQWKNLVEPLIQATQPNVVLVSLGTNDAVSTSLRSAFAANMRAICAQVRDSAARCVWLMPPNRNAALVAPDAGTETLVAPALQLQPDNIHPTPAGYRTWAEFIASLL